MTVSYRDPDGHGVSAVVTLLADSVGTTVAPTIAAAGLDSTGAGVATAAPLFQYDDVSTAVVTENQFAPGRISSRRAQLIERLTPTSFTWTPTLDTSAYATGDSLYSTATTITSVVPANGGTFLLEKLTVLDKSSPSTVNNPSAMDVLFFNAIPTLSAANAAAALPSDAHMGLCIGWVPIGTYTTTTINSFGQWSGQLLLPLGAATTSLFIAVIVRGTPTYTDGDLVFTAYGRPLA